MLELLRKTYTLEIEFTVEKTVKFTYQQAIFKEILSLCKTIEDQINLGEWLYDFLMKKCTQDVKMIKEDFNMLNEDQVTRIMNFTLDTYGRKYFSTSEKIDIKKKAKSPSSSFITFILKETNETLDSLLNLTWEQIEFLQEGVVWNLNEQSKEGRQRNKMQAIMKEAREELSDEDALKQVRAMEKRLKHKNP